LTLRYSLPLSVWVDPSAEHIYIDHSPGAALGRRVGGTGSHPAEVRTRARIHIRNRIYTYTIGCTIYMYVYLLVAHDIYMYISHSREAALARRVGGTVSRPAAAPARERIRIEDIVDISTIDCTI